MRRTHMNLALPFPPSINSIYIPIGRGRQILSKKAVEYHQLFEKLLNEQGHPGKSSGFLEARVWICPPDRRARDCDNILKILFDAMQKCGIYENDSQIKRVDLVMDYWPFPDGAVVVKLDEIPFHDYESKTNSALLTRLQEARTALGLSNKKDIPRPKPPKNPMLSLTQEEQEFWLSQGGRGKL